MQLAEDHRTISFRELTLKTVVVHTGTYFVMGLLAMQFLDYAQRFVRPEMLIFMRPLSDPLVAAGPLLQPVRGFIFALVFYPIRDTLFIKKHGWAVMWLLLVGLGILSTFGPSPGSVEGIIYTSIPLELQLFGLPEVLLQSLFLSAILCYWISHPGNKRLAWAMSLLFVSALTASVLGIILRPA